MNGEELNLKNRSESLVEGYDKNTVVRELRELSEELNSCDPNENKDRIKEIGLRIKQLADVIKNFPK